MEEFKPGDVVRLKSGGPDMTIKGTVASLKGKPAYAILMRAGHEDTQVICQYWSKIENIFETNYFDPIMLQLV